MPMQDSCMLVVRLRTTKTTASQTFHSIVLRYSSSLELSGARKTEYSQNVAKC